MIKFVGLKEVTGSLYFDDKFIVLHKLDKKFECTEIYYNQITVSDYNYILVQYSDQKIVKYDFANYLSEDLMQYLNHKIKCHQKDVYQSNHLKEMIYISFYKIIDASPVLIVFTKNKILLTEVSFVTNINYYPTDTYEIEYSSIKILNSYTSSITYKNKEHRFDLDEWESLFLSEIVNERT